MKMDRDLNTLETPKSTSEVEFYFQAKLPKYNNDNYFDNRNSEDENEFMQESNDEDNEYSIVSHTKEDDDFFSESEKVQELKSEKKIINERRINPQIKLSLSSYIMKKPSSPIVRFVDNYDKNSLNKFEDKKSNLTRSYNIIKPGFIEPPKLKKSNTFYPNIEINRNFKDENASCYFLNHFIHKGGRIDFTKNLLQFDQNQSFINRVSLIQTMWFRHLIRKKIKLRKIILIQSFWRTFKLRANLYKTIERYYIGKSFERHFRKLDFFTLKRNFGIFANRLGFTLDYQFEDNLNQNILEDSLYESENTDCRNCQFLTNKIEDLENEIEDFKENQNKSFDNIIIVKNDKLSYYGKEVINSFNQDDFIIIKEEIKLNKTEKKINFEIIKNDILEFNNKIKSFEKNLKVFKNDDYELLLKRRIPNFEISLNVENLEVNPHEKFITNKKIECINNYIQEKIKSLKNILSDNFSIHENREFTKTSIQIDYSIEKINLKSNKRNNYSDKDNLPILENELEIICKKEKKIIKTTVIKKIVKKLKPSLLLGNMSPTENSVINTEDNNELLKDNLVSKISNLELSTNETFYIKAAYSRVKKFDTILEDFNSLKFSLEKSKKENKFDIQYFDINYKNKYERVRADLFTKTFNEVNVELVREYTITELDRKLLKKLGEFKIDSENQLENIYDKVYRRNVYVKSLNDELQFLYEKKKIELKLSKNFNIFYDKKAKSKLEITLNENIFYDKKSQPKLEIILNENILFDKKEKSKLEITLNENIFYDKKSQPKLEIILNDNIFYDKKQKPENIQISENSVEYNKFYCKLISTITNQIERKWERNSLFYFSKWKETVTKIHHKEDSDNLKANLFTKIILGFKSKKHLHYLKYNLNIWRDTIKEEQIHKNKNKSELLKKLSQILKDSNKNYVYYNLIEELSKIRETKHKREIMIKALKKLNADNDLKILISFDKWRFYNLKKMHLAKMISEKIKNRFKLNEKLNLSVAFRRFNKIVKYLKEEDKLKNMNQNFCVNIIKNLFSSKDKTTKSVYFRNWQGKVENFNRKIEIQNLNSQHKMNFSLLKLMKNLNIKDEVLNKTTMFYYFTIWKTQNRKLRGICPAESIEINYMPQKGYGYKKLKSDFIKLEEFEILGAPKPQQEKYSLIIENRQFQNKTKFVSFKSVSQKFERKIITQSNRKSNILTQITNKFLIKILSKYFVRFLKPLELKEVVIPLTPKLSDKRNSIMPQEIKSKKIIAPKIVMAKKKTIEETELITTPIQVKLKISPNTITSFKRLESQKIYEFKNKFTMKDYFIRWREDRMKRSFKSSSRMTISELEIELEKKKLTEINKIKFVAMFTIRKKTLLGKFFKKWIENVNINKDNCFEKYSNQLEKKEVKVKNKLINFKSMTVKAEVQQINSKSDKTNNNINYEETNFDFIKNWREKLQVSLSERIEFIHTETNQNHSNAYIIMDNSMATFNKDNHQNVLSSRIGMSKHYKKKKTLTHGRILSPSEQISDADFTYNSQYHESYFSQEIDGYDDMTIGLVIEIQNAWRNYKMRQYLYSYSYWLNILNHLFYSLKDKNYLVMKKFLRKWKKVCVSENMTDASNIIKLALKEKIKAKKIKITSEQFLNFNKKD